MPSLNLTAFKKQVAQRRLDPLYLVVGEDLKLADRLIDDLESSIDPSERPFGVQRFYAGEATSAPVDIVAAARTLPMLGDRRLVLVLRAERLLKTKRAKAGTSTEDEGDTSDREQGDGDDMGDVTALEEYVAEPSSSTTLVFVASSVDRSRRLTKRLLEMAQVVECGRLAADGPGSRGDARAAARDWLAAEFRRAGRAIDPQVSELLIDRAGHDITKLRADVERLLLFVDAAARIETADVLAVTVQDDGVVDDEWGVVNAIAAGDAAAALAEVARRFERGDSPHGLVGQLRWWVANRLVGGDPRRVKGAVEALLRTDLALKSSGGEDRVLVERLVVELTGKSIAQAGWQRR